MFSYFNRNYKKKIFIILFFLLFLIAFYAFNNSYSKRNIDIIKKDRTFNNFLVTSIKYYDSYLCFDKEKGDFYTNNKRIDVNKIEIISPYKTKFLVEKIDNSNYNLFVYSDEFYQNLNIKIADISLLSLRTFNSISDYLHNNTNLFFQKIDFNDLNNDSVSNINFTLYDNNYQVHGLKENYIFSNAKMYVRGATSLYFPKKSYRIILDKGKSLLGMPSDKDWILDALYTDESKVRNKLSFDLWNKINDNQIIDNDLSGEFVEVFIDDSYVGLYVIKEKVNKKRLNISNDGILTKSISHSDEYIRKSFIEKNLSDIFIKENNMLGNFEVKFYSKTSLESFYYIMSNCYLYGFDFDTINSFFDINNYIDYKLILLLTYGDDNLTKNQYLSMSNHDSKILITPWDMDLTWGLFSTGGNETLSYKINGSFSNVSWVNSLTADMDDKTLSLLKRRYWELRKDVITLDTINGYLDSYKELLVESGAAKRDSDRWYEYDVEYEIEQIREWANYRIQFLDEYFK